MCCATKPRKNLLRNNECPLLFDCATFVACKNVIASDRKQYKAWDNKLCNVAI